MKALRPALRWIRTNETWIKLAVLVLFLITAALYFGIVLGITGGHAGQYGWIEVLMLLDRLFSGL